MHLYFCSFLITRFSSIKNQNQKWNDFVRLLCHCRLRNLPVVPKLDLLTTPRRSNWGNHGRTAKRCVFSLAVDVYTFKETVDGGHELLHLHQAIFSVFRTVWSLISFVSIMYVVYFFFVSNKECQGVKIFVSYLIIYIISFFGKRPKPMNLRQCLISW